MGKGRAMESAARLRERKELEQLSALLVDAADASINRDDGDTLILAWQDLLIALADTYDIAPRQ